MRILGLLLFIGIIYAAYKSNQPSNDDILNFDPDNPNNKDEPTSTQSYEIKD